MKLKLALALSALVSLEATARIATYTRHESSDTQIALGLDVPRPVESSTAMAGYRSYQGLINGLELLALQSPDLQRWQIGNSLNQRPILAWTFGQGRQLSMLQTGGSHAREWASPEAVGGIIERLTAAADDGGIESWLRDRAQIILVPVLNPDGFIASQHHFDSTRIAEDPNDSSPANGPSRSLLPRDGRMRRKNLRSSDGDLAGADDSLLGVDINRNIGQFWAASSRSSSDPRSVVYHGTHEQSEPETRALIQAAELAEPNSLRLYIDTHSFGRVLFYNRSGNELLLANTEKLVELIRQVPAKSYAAHQEPAGQGIGASDEFFAYSSDYEVPSYTLEIEPGQEQIAEYGGNAGVTHSGFILPDSEVPRMRDEVYQMSLLAYYHQAGAPILKSLLISELSSQEPVYFAQWDKQANGRVLSSTQSQPIQACQRYRAKLVFDKPMRLRSHDNRIVGYPGQAAPNPPQIKLGGQALDSSQGQWSDTTYQADSFSFEFSSRNTSGLHNLSIAARDLAGMNLDSDPSTIIHWQNGQWHNWENNAGLASQQGGADQNIKLVVDASESCATSEPSSGGGGGLSWLMLTLLALTRGRQ